MALPEENFYTVEDIFALPDGQRAELINGRFYMMAPPGFRHQKLVGELYYTIRDFIKKNSGQCEVIPAPFAVFPEADDKTYVEPDICVICDKSKLDDRGCNGAPDWVIEIVSSSTRRMDYYIKNSTYALSGVREYWIVDPVKERVTVYRYETDEAPVIYSFEQDIPVGIYSGFTINVTGLIK